jgi:hypothetical protein
VSGTHEEFPTNQPTDSTEQAHKEQSLVRGRTGGSIARDYPVAKETIVQLNYHTLTTR